MKRTIFIGIAVIVVLFAVAYGGSRYLTSKLDGTGGVTAPQGGGTPAGFISFWDPKMGIEFLYPETYTLSAAPDDGGDTLIFLPKGYTPPVNGEGPPTITVRIIYSVGDIPLETWVRNDLRSNFQLGDGTLVATTVGGQPAFSYHHSGLYETDAYAVSYRGTVYVFSVGWLAANDQQVHDFDRLIESVQFN